MLFILILSSVVILSAIFSNKFLNALGIPTLLFFLCLGMLFGTDGIFKINYSDFELTKELSSVALGFIIFYGGFCTKWNNAKLILGKACFLSTLGVVFTALIVGLFCHFVLKINYLESLLIGSVIGSTDAASVFSILKSKTLILKENTASLLELESGSNDPMSYVLVVLAITLIQGERANVVTILFFKQMIFGILTGFFIAKITIYFFQKTTIITEGNDNLFIISTILLAYTLPLLYDGNPFLSVYLLGIIIGNSRIDNKQSMLNFFDGITKLAQIGIFFTLGLLASPSKLLGILYSGSLIFLFLTFIARPFVVFFQLSFFESSIGQKIVVSWAGLRGVASIVFTIVAMDSGINVQYDLFHLVFLITILSVAIQGTLLPKISKLTNMIDENLVLDKSFKDYEEECAVKFMRITIPLEHAWIGKKIRDITFPDNALVLVIKRGPHKILPKNTTKILAGDRLTLTVNVE